MKTFRIFSFLFISFICSNCIAQDNKDAEKIIMIKKFYISYSKLWAIKPLPPPKEFYKKLDSLQKIYCTQKLRKKAKDWFEDDGHDLYTNDWGIAPNDTSSITVLKDFKAQNKYILRYTTLFHESPSKYVKRNVTLNLEVVRIDNEYKIDAVLDEGVVK